MIVTAIWIIATRPLNPGISVTDKYSVMGKSPGGDLILEAHGFFTS